MANQPVVDPATRCKCSINGSQITTRSQRVSQQKKAGHPIEHRVEEDCSYLYSAYLAERGCLSPTIPVKQIDSLSDQLFHRLSC